MPHPVFLYDGVCGLCNRLVQFILRRDRKAIFQFAALQSPLAARLLSHHNADPTDLNTVYVVVNRERPDEYVLSRSEAVIFVLRQLGSFWRATAALAQFMPKSLRDALYNAIARHRYRIFGRSEVCTLPRDQDHSRFLDI